MPVQVTIECSEIVLFARLRRPICVWHHRALLVNMHRTYPVLRSVVLLAAWRTVRLPSERGAGLHVAVGLQSPHIMRTFPFGFCTTTMDVAYLLWTTRVIIHKSSKRCSSLSTAYIRLNGNGIGLTNLATSSYFNRNGFRSGAEPQSGCEDSCVLV